MNRVIDRAGAAVLAAAMIAGAALIALLDTRYVKPEAITVATGTMACHMEDPLESVKIADAVAASVGTEAEIPTLGYDYEYVLRVVTHEANRDYELCMAVATAIRNGCIRYGGLLSPEELCRQYRYATPSDFISDAARQACEDVLIRGMAYEAIGNATVFYNPNLCTPRYHTSEHCEAVATVSGIIFCRELDEP